MDNINYINDNCNRLIEELERSERRLTEVRVTYEKKLNELSVRIRTMEAERDRVVSDLMAKEKGNDGKKESEAARVKERMRKII